MNKLPLNAKKVFQGEIFQIYQWEQEMFDGSTQTFEVVKRKNSVQVIAITKSNTFLVLNEKQPGTKLFTSLVGGRIDDENVTPLDQAKEELLEETGFKSDKWEFMYSENLGSKIMYETFYFLAKDCYKVSEQNLDKGGEEINIIELSFDEFISFTQQKTFRNKAFSNFIFKILNDPQQFEIFKKRVS